MVARWGVMPDGEFWVVVHTTLVVRDRYARDSDMVLVLVVEHGSVMGR